MKICIRKNGNIGCFDGQTTQILKIFRDFCIKYDDDDAHKVLNQVSFPSRKGSISFFALLPCLVALISTVFNDDEFEMTDNKHINEKRKIPFSVV